MVVFLSLDPKGDKKVCTPLSGVWYWGISLVITSSWFQNHLQSLAHQHECGQLPSVGSIQISYWSWIASLGNMWLALFVLASIELFLPDPELSEYYGKVTWPFTPCSWHLTVSKARPESLCEDSLLGSIILEGEQLPLVWLREEDSREGLKPKLRNAACPDKKAGLPLLDLTWAIYLE